MCEMGLVHRHELSGCVARPDAGGAPFTQDDAHLFMLPGQIIGEITGIIDLIDRFYSLFGFPYRVELSTGARKINGFR